MGLDMMLYRMPRYKNTTASEVSAIENYFDWLKAKKEGSKYADCTLKEWCGIDESELPSKDVIEFYKPTRNFILFGTPSINMDTIESWSRLVIGEKQIRFIIGS